MSSSSFKNIILHYHKEGYYESDESNVNDLLMTQENQFTGWECWAGVQNITIDNQGKVWRAICKQGEPLGDIHNGFKVPEEDDTIICQKKFCNCAADIQLTKRHPAHQGITRLAKKDSSNE